MRKRCVYCKRLYQPDPRLTGKQKTCGSEACQKERRRENARKWRGDNPDYDSGEYRKIRHLHRRGWKRQYWETHPEYRKHHAEYMRWWRGMKKLPEESVRVPYRDIAVTYCKQKTSVDITSVRVPYRVMASILLCSKDLSSILQA